MWSTWAWNSIWFSCQLLHLEAAFSNFSEFVEVELLHFWPNIFILCSRFWTTIIRGHLLLDYNALLILFLPKSFYTFSVWFLSSEYILPCLLSVPCSSKSYMYSILRQGLVLVSCDEACEGYRWGGGEGSCRCGGCCTSNTRWHSREEEMRLGDSEHRLLR